MDNFEKHIRENRLLFDEHGADKEKLWRNISSRLDSTETKKIRLWKSPLLKIAASVLIIVGIFSISNLNDVNSQKNRMVTKELNDIDVYYSNLVSQQIELVKKHPSLSTNDKKEFLLFINELDEELSELKLEMKEDLNNERILEAIIKNYKQRIELIENLLQQINDSKKINDNNGYIL